MVSVAGLSEVGAEESLPPLQAASMRRVAAVSIHLFTAISYYLYCYYVRHYHSQSENGMAEKPGYESITAAAYRNDQQYRYGDGVLNV